MWSCALGPELRNFEHFFLLFPGEEKDAFWFQPPLLLPFSPSLSSTSFIMQCKETEVLETTPLLGSECNDMQYTGRDSLASTCIIRHHSPKSSTIITSSQLQSGPLCFESSDTEHGKTSSPSPDCQHKCSEQLQPLLSRSQPFHSIRNSLGLRLENSGSVARDHLACERTFLAYMRTSLAIASAGVGKFCYMFRAYSRVTTSFLRSTCTALFGCFIIITIIACLLAQTLRSSAGCFYGCRRPLGPVHRFVTKFMPSNYATLISFPSGITRYFTVQVALIKGVFPVSRLATGFVAMMLGVLVALTFGILLADSKLGPK